MMNPRLPTRFLRLGGAFLLLMALFFLSQSSQTTAAGLGSGPGGVDSTDGAGNLRLWLRASDLTASPVAAWGDQSGYNNHATQGTAANQPTLQANVWNGQPAVRFDGTNDHLELPFILNPTNPNGYTLIAVTQVANTTASHTIVQQLDGTGTGRTLMSFRRISAADRRISTFLGNANRDATTVYTANTGYLAGITWPGTTTGTLTHYLNAVADGTHAFNTAESTLGTWRLGSGKTLANWLNGDLAEVIVYDRVLNAAERILVFNYLNAKYDIALVAGNDFYEGDTNGNGDFDFDVAGIGRQAGANNALALAGGLQVANNTFLQDDGDFLIFGHNGTANANSAADLPGGVVQRWTRTWYIDVSDDSTTVGGTVDITFDFSEAGMNGTPAGAAANYRLLTRAGLAGAFTDVASATSIAGDQVTFTGIDIADVTSVYMTLGTADAAVSPTAVTLQTTNIPATSAWPLLVLALLLGLATAALSRRQRAS